MVNFNPNNMKIQLKGQLQTAAGMSNLEIEASGDETLRDVIQSAAQKLPEAAKALITDESGDVRASLFIAVDGEHTRDLDQPATANELILMPPMAGG